jgi:hypothetical protein
MVLDDDENPVAEVAEAAVREEDDDNTDDGVEHIMLGSRRHRSRSRDREDDRQDRQDDTNTDVASKDQDDTGAASGAEGANGVNESANTDAGPAIPEAVGEIDEAEVHKLLIEREVHRIAKNFVEADQVREKLLSYGVTVDDRKRTWVHSEDPDRPGVRPSAHDEVLEWVPSSRAKFVEPVIDRSHQMQGKGQGKGKGWRGKGGGNRNRGKGDGWGWGKGDGGYVRGGYRDDYRRDERGGYGYGRASGSADRGGGGAYHYLMCPYAR